jgi:hypothetical protein
MKWLIGLSAIAILFGIANARAEERITGNSILPVAQRGAQKYSRQRYRQSYRRLGYRSGPYGSIYRRRGPYVQYLGPDGRPTGPLPPTITGD